MRQVGKTPVAQLDGHHLHLQNPNDFSHPMTAGVQYKGSIELDQQAYFLKSDDLIPGSGLQFEHQNYDAMFSSVSEAITACFVKNMKPDPNFQSVLYHFAIVDNLPGLNGPSTCTYSRNFLSDNEIELRMSHNLSQTPANEIMISIKNFADRVADADLESAIVFLQATYQKLNISPEATKYFLVQQMGFDILTGNQDRQQNPGNFSVAYNAESKSGHWINMDYGRCFQIKFWNDRFENHHQFDKPRDEYYQEDIDFAIQNFDQISGLHPYSKRNMDIALESLNNLGFIPFEINVQQLRQDLSTLKEQFKATDFPGRNFAVFKVEAVEHYLTTDKFKKFTKEWITD